MNLADQTVEELRQMAAARQISGRGEMNKAQLIAALEDADLSIRVAQLEQRVASLEEAVTVKRPLA